MKRVKKILSMMLCSVIIIGGSNFTLVKAHGQTINKDSVSTQQVNSRSTSNQNYDRWVTSVGFRLKDKFFPFCKCFWHLDLVLTNENKLMLRGNTNIPRKYTFDDVFVLGYDKWGAPYNITKFRGLNNVDAKYALKRATDLFNNEGITVGNTIFIHGENSNNSLVFESKIQPGSQSHYPTSIIQYGQTRNDYSKGYLSVDRFAIGLRVEERGLREVPFKH